MSARYMNENGSMVQRDNGCWMLVTAHAAEVEQLEAKAYETKCWCDGYMAELERMGAAVHQLTAERDAAVARADRVEALASYVSSDHILGQLTRIFGPGQRELVELRRIIAALAAEPDNISQPGKKGRIRRPAPGTVGRAGGIAMESFFNTVAWICLIIFGFQAVGRLLIHLWQEYTESGSRDAFMDMILGRQVGKVWPVAIMAAISAAWIWR